MSKKKIQETFEKGNHNYTVEIVFDYNSTHDQIKVWCEDFHSKRTEVCLYIPQRYWTREGIYKASFRESLNETVANCVKKVEEVTGKDTEWRYNEACKIVKELTGSCFS